MSTHASFIRHARSALSASTTTPHELMQIIYCAAARTFYEQAKTELAQFAIVLTARERELERIANGGAK